MTLRNLLAGLLSLTISTWSFAVCVAEPPTKIRLAVESCVLKHSDIPWIHGKSREWGNADTTGLDASPSEGYVWQNDLYDSCDSAKPGSIITVFRHSKCCDTVLIIDEVKFYPCENEPYLISANP
jgi:hypothetical protein